MKSSSKTEPFEKTEHLSTFQSLHSEVLHISHYDQSRSGTLFSLLLYLFPLLLQSVQI